MDLDKILEGLGNDIEELDGKLAEYKEANDKRVKAIEDAGYISETVIDGKISDAAQKLDTKIDTEVGKINTELGKYILKAEIDKFLTGTKVVAALQTAGFALTSDLDAYVKTTVMNSKLEDYLKKADLTTEAIEKLNFLQKGDIQDIADAARDAAQEHAHADLKDAIDAYDAQLAQALEALFAQITGAAGDNANGDDDDEAIELPTAAKDAIAALKAAFEANQGVSPAVATEIDLLWIGLTGKLTSLVFYPETYYGGIESIEITALKIDTTYSLKNVEFDGTALEEFQYDKQTRREFDLFPNGYAKYHINPVNANLEDYTLSFIDHTAKTRDAEGSYLIPVEEEAAKNYRDENDVLWVEFENNAAVYNTINKATKIPGMGHYSYKTASYTIPGVDGKIDEYKESHFTYGEGEVYSQGIVTALTATNEEAEDESSYVASDYALIVPVTIQRLVLANTKFGFQNDEWETSKLTDEAFDNTNVTHYSCNAANTFHLHRKVLERIGDDDAINKLNYKQKFDLKKLVETHFVNSANSFANVDEKVDEDLFRRLNLAYRFKEIDYTTAVKYDGDDWYDRYQHFTSESKFITLLNKDEDGYSDGEGYFNMVTEQKDTNGKKVEDPNNEFGGQYKTANDACLGRQPVVRVELYNKENGYIYAIGYLKLEISKDIEKDAEAFISTGEGQLFASCEGDCDDDADAIYLRWDQIQAQLNDLNGGEGLSPKDWNAYEVAELAEVYDETSGKLIDRKQVQYASVEPTDVLKDIFKISKNYDENDYPYYQLGTIEKVGDQDVQSGASEATGVWTDVLKWKFCTDDYKALFYDAVKRGAINETTGTIDMPIWRYVKLTSSDTSKPDLYVGIYIPAGKIHFPAGTIGRVKNAYWKEAASNKEPANQEDYKDLVLNVDLNIGNDAGTAAEESDMVKNGWFYNKIVKNFYGEEIRVDMTNALNAIDEDLRDEAALKWESAETYYVGSQFYFRMPDASDSNEKKVYNAKGEWEVNGMSGATYTLQVTELQLMCQATNYKKYWTYGKSISITKINGIPVTAADGAYLVELEEGNPDSKIMAIPFIIVNPETSVVYMKIAKNGKNKVTIDETDYMVGDEVATYAQDMLNYAKHDWNEQRVGGENQTARPYNMQLTAFLEIVATNSDKTIVMPGQMAPFKPESDRMYGTNNTCFIMPGYMQGVDCQYCYTETSDECLIEAYNGCFAPEVNEGNKFAIRFYEPVYIGNNLTGVEITDAMLADKTKMKFSYQDFLYLEDWAGYHSKDAKKINNTKDDATLFSNFVDYYGIKVSQPEEMTVAYWENKMQEIIDNAGSTVDPKKYDLPENFGTAMAAAADALGKADPATEAEVLNLLKAAEKGISDMENNIWPAGTKNTVFGKEYNIGTRPYKTSLNDANKKAYDDLAKFSKNNIDLWEKGQDAGNTTPGVASGNPISFDNWLKSEKIKKPKFINLAATTTVTDIKYSDTEMDGTSDPYTLQTSLAGGNYAKKDYSNVEIVTVSEGSYWFDGTEYVTKAAAEAEKATKVLAYQLWKKDCENFEKFYGIDRGNPIAAEWQDAEKKKVEKYEYQYAVRQGTDKTLSGKTLGQQTTEGDAYDPLNKLTTASQAALTANNWGVKGTSTYTDYIDYLDDYNELMANQEFVDAYTAWYALGENNVRAEVANYLKVQEIVDDAELNSLAVLTAFIEMMDELSDVDTYAWDDEDIKDDVTDYLLAVAAAEAAANAAIISGKTAEQLAAEAWKDLYLTDLGLPQADRTKPETLAALKTALGKARTIREAAPERLQFEITDYGEFVQNGSSIGGEIKFIYNNNNANTNVPFNIYVPFDVTYNYLDREPLKVRVWAVVTVKSTKANTDTTPTTGARRK